MTPSNHIQKVAASLAVTQTISRVEEIKKAILNLDTDALVGLIGPLQTVILADNQERAQELAEIAHDLSDSNWSEGYLALEDSTEAFHDDSLASLTFWFGPDQHYCIVVSVVSVEPQTSRWQFAVRYGAKDQNVHDYCTQYGIFGAKSEEPPNLLTTLPVALDLAHSFCAGYEHMQEFHPEEAKGITDNARKIIDWSVASDYEMAASLALGVLYMMHPTPAAFLPYDPNDLASEDDPAVQALVTATVAASIQPEH